MSEQKPLFTAEELGDTLGARRKFTVRMLLMTALVAGVITVVVVGNSIATDGVPDALGADDSSAASTTAGSSDATTAVGTVGDDAAGDESSADESAASSASYVAQGRLVKSEDHRLYVIARQGQRGAAKGEPTLVLDGANGPYSLATLIHRGAMVREGDNTFRLVKRVVVQRGATLRIDKPGATILLTSGAKKLTSIVGWGANVTLVGTAEKPLTVKSYDPATQGADLDLSDGRAYIRVDEATLSTRNVAVSSLGFWSGRTGGLAVTGTIENPGRASIRSTTSGDLQVGLYLSAVVDSRVVDSVIDSSRQQGIEIGNGSSLVAIRRTTIENSGTSGIVARTGTSDLVLDHVTVADNPEIGLRFDGAALASGPNSAGYSVENAHGLVVRDSTFTNNRGGGIVVESTHAVSISRTTLTQRGIALSVSGDSRGVVLDALVAESTVRDAVQVSDGVKHLVVRRSTLTGVHTGIMVRDADLAALANTVTVESGTGIHLSGKHANAVVIANDFHGRGPDAILVQQASGSVSDIGNTVSGWTVQTEVLKWWEDHPLAWLWGALLVIPFIGVFFIFRRSRSQRKLRALVESTTLAVALAEKERYDEARATGRPTQAQDLPELAPVSPDDVSLEAFPELEEDLAPEDLAPRRTTRLPPPLAAPKSSPEGGELRSTDTLVSDSLVSDRLSPNYAPPPTAPSPFSARFAPPLRDAVPSMPRVSRDVAEAASAGRFSSVEQLAVSAVLEGQKPISVVARTLKVPTSLVAYWVSKVESGGPR